MTELESDKDRWQLPSAGHPTLVPSTDRASESTTWTVDDAIEAVGFGRLQWLLLGYAGLAWMGEAMELMLLSFVGPAVQAEWSLSSQQESAISSVVFMGMLVGAYTWGLLSDAKGRRAGFSATAALTFGASLLSAFSPGYPALLALRALVGVGLGGAPVIFSLFMEFVPAARRGFWMVALSLFWTLGSVAEASLAWAILPTLGWRWLLVLSSAPLALLLLLYPFLPESPRFYSAKGLYVEAFEVLQRLAATNRVPLPAGRLAGLLRDEKSVQEEDRLSLKPEPLAAPKSTPLGEIKLRQQPGVEMENPSGLLPGEGRADFTRSKESPNGEVGPFAVLGTLLAAPLRRSTLLLWGVFFANAFTYYGLVLLTSQLTGGGGHCGTEPVQAALQTGIGAPGFFKDIFITSFAELPGIGLAAVVVDRLGRKRTISILLAATGVAMVPLVQPLGEDLTTALLFAARACIMGAFQVLFVYAPEVYPTTTRSTGLGIANSFSRLGGIICPFVAVDLVRNCQVPLAVSMFVVIPLGAAGAVLNFPTETTGRALTEVAD